MIKFIHTGIAPIVFVNKFLAQVKSLFVGHMSIILYNIHPQYQYFDQTGQNLWYDTIHVQIQRIEINPNLFLLYSVQNIYISHI